MEPFFLATVNSILFLLPVEPASGPEELHPKSHRPEVGPTEKSETDRKRERRAQRLKNAEKKMQEKVSNKLRPALGKKKIQIQLTNRKQTDFGMET